jgi:hypothetical protein
MAWYIARSPDNRVSSVNDDDGLEEIYRYFDLGWTIYRLEPAVTPGQFTMIPQQLNPASIVTDSVTVGGTLEDA